MSLEEKRKILQINWRLQKTNEENAFATVHNFLLLVGCVTESAWLEQQLLPITNESGASLHDIENILNRLSVVAKSFKLPAEKISAIHFPAITIINKRESTEFVVLYGLVNDEVIYLSPRLGWVFEALQDFLCFWDGYTLMTSSHFISPTITSPETMNDSIVSVFDNFLTEEECSFLIKTSEPLFQKSKVFGEGHNFIVNENRRKSQSAYLNGGESPLNDLRSKLSHKLKIDKNRFEHLQCVSYNTGDFFDYHFDAVDSDANPRMHTLLIYLNDDFVGGETAFPMLNKRITPVLGRAVFFRNINEDGQICKESTHAGLPVIQGKKYALNLWIHRTPLNP